VYAFTLVEKRIDKQWLERNLNREKLYSHEKVCTELGLQLTPLDRTIAAAVESFMEAGIVKYDSSKIFLLQFTNIAYRPNPKSKLFYYLTAGVMAAAAVGAVVWQKQK